MYVSQELELLSYELICIAAWGLICQWETEGQRCCQSFFSRTRQDCSRKGVRCGLSVAMSDLNMGTMWRTARGWIGLCLRCVVLYAVVYEINSRWLLAVTQSVEHACHWFLWEEVEGNQNGWLGGHAIGGGWDRGVGKICHGILITKPGDPHVSRSWC